MELVMINELNINNQLSEVDGVVVEAKSILTSLKIIKTVCEDNLLCKDCPLGDNEGNCKLKRLEPRSWQISELDSIWRALR